MLHWFWLFVIVELCGAAHTVMKHKIVDEDDIIPQATKLVYTTHHKVENITNVTYHLNEEALSMLLRLTDDASFEIVSAIGQARKGKSYTLSQIIQKMTGQWFTAFKSSGYNEPCTHGIWMYVLPKCGNNHDHVNIALNYDGSTEHYPCSDDNKQYIILDIEGSNTETDDEALRYASIVTLLSSQTFLFLDKKLYKQDTDHIRHIQTFINLMNDENIDFDINDINLGAIVRDPFKSKHDDIAKTVNADLSQYAELIGNFHFTSVHQITDYNRDGYDESIQKIVEYLSIDKKSRMKWIDVNKFQILLTEVIDQLNNNKNFSTICLECIWTPVVEWLPYQEFTECSAKCDGGIKTRYRKCNTGNTNDCVARIGGTEMDTQQCNTFKCEWLPFDQWETCSKSCGVGKQQGYRKCSTGNAQDCKDMFGGNAFEIRDCNTRKCKWESVGPWSTCSKKCGGGQETRARRCETGKDSDCDGINYETKACHSHECRWFDNGIGRCSAVCGTGRQQVYRYCESGDDADCDGDNYRWQHCSDYSGCDDDDDCNFLFICFSNDSQVMTWPYYESKSINEINVSDKILSYDEWNNEYIFAEIMLWNSNEHLTKMIRFALGEENNITMTPSHMIYVSKPGRSEILLLPASGVDIGDVMHGFNQNDTTIVGIQYIYASPRTVITANGNIVVNGFAASSFTGNEFFDHYVKYYVVKVFCYNMLSLRWIEYFQDYRGIYYTGIVIVVAAILLHSKKHK